MISRPGDKAVKVARFAERLAEHGDRQRATEELGVSKSYGRILFGCIVRELGRQAA